VEQLAGENRETHPGSLLFYYFPVDILEINQNYPSPKKGGENARFKNRNKKLYNGKERKLS
jgi:hypothetical protein